MSSTNSTSAITSAQGTGDAAVTGLFYGLASGLVMGVYLVLAALSQGVGVIELWSSFAGVLSNPLAGITGHLAVSAVYGLVWGCCGARYTAGCRIYPPGWPDWAMAWRCWRSLRLR